MDDAVKFLVVVEANLEAGQFIGLLKFANQERLFLVEKQKLFLYLFVWWARQQKRQKRRFLLLKGPTQFRESDQNKRSFSCPARTTNRVRRSVPPNIVLS